MYPSASPTWYERVVLGRTEGRRLRTGLASSAGSGSAAVFFLSADSGCATLQLSR
jgi:hypothetical protein